MKGLEHLTWARLWGLVPSVSFQWPLFLWLLLLVPLLVAAYILLLYRRKKTAFRYSNLALVKEAAEGPGWRRHIPPALMLAAFTLLLLGMARPSAEVSLPSRVATVMLVMDVSGSMRAADVNPSRIMAAETAAKAYIKQRMAAFPMGLKGKPSYLNDKIEGPTYIATELGAPSTTPIAPGATATATGDGGPDAGTDD